MHTIGYAVEQTTSIASAAPDGNTLNALHIEFKKELELEEITLEKRLTLASLLLIFIPGMRCITGDLQKNNATTGSITTYKNCSGYYLINGRLYLNDLELKGVDLKSFSCIQDEYSKDKNHVYFGSTIATDADPKTFKVLANGYAKDKKRVYIDYYSGKSIDGADPVSFKLFADMAFSKDKHHVYQQYEIGLIKIIEEADAASFDQLANTTCYRDKKHLFNISGEILLDITTINPEELSSYCGF